MEISATTSSSYMPTQFSEVRAARNSARDSGGGKTNPVTAVPDQTKNYTPTTSSPTNISSPVDVNSLDIPRTKKVTENQASAPAQSEKESQKADQTLNAQPPKQEDVSIATGGGIKLDIEDGHRVLKVFDSKDVLIYQLPPKGTLQLIESQDSTLKPQVQTSA